MTDTPPEVPDPRSPDGQDDGELLLDPYHVPPPAPPPLRAGVSSLAWSALFSAILLGPVGAILAILFGWYARREIDRDRTRKSGYALATTGLVLGLVLTPAWGAALTYFVWMHTLRSEPIATHAPPEPTAHDRDPAPEPPAVPSLPLVFAPKTTRVAREGKITVVDLGTSTASVADDLARQRARAATADETLIVMTTLADCVPCRGVDAALADPLMQTALARVRLVRIDVRVFAEDLDGLSIPRERIPGFYLLAPDLSPRDGVDGGEWDDDVARNIAPVLGAFVRGKYDRRRETWRPVPGHGVTL